MHDFSSQEAPISYPDPPPSDRDFLESVDITQNRIQDTLQKASGVVDGHLNAFALKTLKDLQQRGKQLSPTHQATAAHAIACLQDDFDRIGREHIHRDLDQSFASDAFPLSTIERLRVETQRRLHQENQHRRKHLSLCVY